MTLIAAAWSPEGFAMAADGLRFKTNPPTKAYDVQKIFQTPFVDDTGFAFGWAGAVEFTFTSGHHFDFNEITQQAMNELPDYAYLESPDDYFSRVARKIFCELPIGIDISGFPDARVLFVGYLAGKSLSVEIDFTHKENAFLPPIVKTPECPPRHFKMFEGSNTIREQMEASGKLFQPVSLLEATKMVREYAQTCVDSNTSVLDCKNFGESVHVATVTQQGFSWDVEPKRK